MFTNHPSKEDASKQAASDKFEYHMTQIKGWSITSDPDAFREGATWYHNGRDWAKEQRDHAIKQANAQAASQVESQSRLSDSPK